MMSRTLFNGEAAKRWWLGVAVALLLVAAAVSRLPRGPLHLEGSYVDAKKNLLIVFGQKRIGQGTGGLSILFHSRGNRVVHQYDFEVISKRLNAHEIELFSAEEPDKSIGLLIKPKTRSDAWTLRLERQLIPADITGRFGDAPLIYKLNS